ncbi:hypothetical protein [Pelagibacterium luteolum]|uniref:hypothetical protein n=1 Tax=Pelagibacterium luteolum TaxID=440168 RepID=UPI00115FC56D|nr:hypothetical protein [Pelagibacterium luteolum]
MEERFLDEVAQEAAEQAQRESERAAIDLVALAEEQARLQEASILETQRLEILNDRVSGPFGPEVAGLQLGMSLEAADRVIRERMEVGVVAELMVGSRTTARIFLTGRYTLPPMPPIVSPSFLMRRSPAGLSAYPSALHCRQMFPQRRLIES